jgi:WD40 repeat protein
MEDSKYQFDVFLSYSRKDEAFGRKLEEALENYTLPKDVNSRAISRKRLNVFRDKKDLVPNDADYYKAIEGYLNKSQYLVVICSPNARASDYVNDEIKAFLTANEANRIIPVLLSGKPNNDSQATPEEYAFPQALCDAAAMPLAVGFTEFVRAPGKLNKGVYHDSWYTLLAKIFGTERAEIERLDAKRQARRRAIFAGVSLAVIAALLVALVFAIISRQQAARERDHAQQLLYASDMNLAQRAYASANVGLGRQLLESHRPKAGEQDLRGFEWYYLWNQYNDYLASFESTNDLVFSSDGSRFATLTADAVKIWDTASRRETMNIALGPVPQGTNTDAFATLALDFSPDGNTLAYGDTKRGTLLLDIASGSSRKIPFPVLGEKQRQSSVLSNEEGIQRYWQLVGGGAPRFSPDGRLLAIDYGCGVVAVHNAKSLSQLATLGEGPPASGCASFVTFSGDGKMLAYGDGYGVGLWDTVTESDLRGPGEEDADVADSIGQLESVAISPDNRTLAIGDRNQQIVLWNISTRKVVGRLKGHTGWVSALAFSPDGKTLYSGGMDQTVKLWDLSSYHGPGPVSAENIKAFATFKGHTAEITSIKCAADGKTVATVSGDHTVKLWAITAGREFETIDNVEQVFPRANLAVTSTAEGEDYKITPLDLGAEIKPPAVKLHKTPRVISPDRKIFAFGSGGLSGQESYAMDLVEPETRRKLASIPIYFLRDFASFSQDSRVFGVIGRDHKSVLLWDAVQKKDLPAIKNDVELRSYLFSPDGKMVVTFDQGSGTVKSWEIASQRRVAQFARNINEDTEQITPSEDDPQTISPDSRVLAFSDSNKVELWQVNEGGAPLVLGNDVMRARVSVVAFSPDGKLLAAGDELGTVRIWDAVTRQELATFMGHKDVVTALAFTADSRTLASAGGARDAAVKVYGMSAMRDLLSLTHEPSATSDVHAGQGSEDYITQLFFSADGKALITHSGNFILRIWRARVPQN